jgi:myosin-5
MRSPGRPGTPSAIANGGGGNASGARATGVDDAIGALDRGSRVWYRQDATTWILAELREPLPAADSTIAAGADGRAGSAALAAPAAVVTLLSGPMAGRVLEGVPASSLLPANPDLQAAIPDLTQLSFLNEPSILGNLQLRYSADHIYTCAGPVLIALNPCKELPLYTPEIQHEYRGGFRRAQKYWAPASSWAGVVAPRGPQ